MGYNTDFNGSLKLSRKLTIAEAKTWLEFAEDDEKYKSTSSIDAYLQWVPSQDFEHLVYDGNEKFYNYTASLEWVLGWLKAIDIFASGSIIWSGEETWDAGVFEVSDSQISIKGFNAPKVEYIEPLTMRKLEKMALEQMASAQVETQQDDHDGSTND